MLFAFLGVTLSGGRRIPAESGESHCHDRHALVDSGEAMAATFSEAVGFGFASASAWAAMAASPLPKRQNMSAVPVRLK